MITFITGSLCRISERYQKTFSEGSYIADLVRKNITQEGIKNLLSYFETASENELNAFITVMGWIDDLEISRALTKFLGHPGTNKKVIDALVPSGKKVTDLLISQLDEDQETKQAAVMALGRIGGEAVVNALIPLLKDDEVAVICCGALAKIGDRRPFNDLLDLLGHPNPSVRRAAVAALNSIGHPDMAGRIPELLTYKDPLVRESSLRIAGYFGFPECRELVYELCSDSDLNVRIAAIEVLPFFEDDHVPSQLKLLYSDENPRIRAAVVRSLGQLESIITDPVFELALNDEDGWVRYYAIKTIGTHGDFEDLAKLREIAIHDPVPFVRLAAIELLGDTGNKLSESILQSLTGDPDHDIALASVRALGNINHPEAVTSLMALSKSGDIEIKKWAIEAMGTPGIKGTTDALQWLALMEKDPHIKETAIKSLRTIATEESIHALINLTSDPDNRERAISALSGFSEDMVDYICDGLKHRHTLVRTSVIEVLLRMHTPVASARLAECLSHADVNVRLAAVDALHRLGNRSFMKKILDLKNSDPDPLIRKAIEDIIQVSALNK